MNGFGIVAIAASAGGLNALFQVLSGLPPGFPVPIVVVQHLDPKHKSLMAGLLNRRVSLTVKEAEQGDSLCPGMIYIAPPDHHFLVDAHQKISLTQSELVNFVRPSADLLLQSVANSYQKKAIAVILTGTGHDGKVGVQAIHNKGGIVIVQNQKTSEYFGMPGSAISTGIADFVVPLADISSTLISLVQK